jgi:hypothetical protein
VCDRVLVNANATQTMIKQQQKLYNGGTKSVTTGTSTDTTNHSFLRPYDTLGPPSDPIEFPRPQLVRGRRDTVVCYNPITDDHEVLENVLFRDCLVGRYANTSNNASSPFTRRGKGDANHHRSNSRNNNTSNSKNSNENVTQAFWPIPYKAKIQTIMGHVEYVDALFMFYF